MPKAQWILFSPGWYEASVDNRSFLLYASETNWAVIRQSSVGGGYKRLAGSCTERQDIVNNMLDAEQWLLEDVERNASRWRTLLP